MTDKKDMATEGTEDRLKGARQIMTQLVKLAA